MYTTHRSQAFARTGKTLLTLGLLPLMLASGCQNMNNTETGALGGAAVGGILGTLVGAAAHNPLAGAAIGAGAGAVVGGAAGASEDHREQRQTQAVTAAVQRGQADLEEVAKMSRSKVDDYTIIQYVRSSGGIFALSGDQIIWLQQNGVSPAVIQAMQATNQPVYYGHRVYVEPAPAIVVGGYYR